ncbi:MAG: methyltransferase domain-containing protein [Lachnospiraceae bacterium]|nr:methyltransferase domain-containing protein [Lachnospiraceae bacterium]
MQLRIAELRKKNNMTQQELGDLLSVSYQTVSKWENGVVLPDVTMLPKLSRCFCVSVDALLGLVPLSQDYQPSDSGCKEYWAGRVDYLKRTRRAMWNEDYLRFLVREVWKIERPVELLDCGCGCGAMGRMLFRLLPKGSRYVGIDFSEEMLAAAKELFASEGMSAEFIHADLFAWESAKRYDIVIGQALLRHVDCGERLLKKMIAQTKAGGLVVSMECNREFEADGLYVEGMDYAGLCTCTGLKKLWQTELSMQNRDYSIAMKIPHYMRRAGLRDVDCRMNDRVNFLCPEQEDYDRRLTDVICADHWDDEKTEEETEKDIAYFINHGMSRKEAEDYCAQQNGIVRYLKQHRGDVAFTKFGGIMISFGWKV